VIKISIEHELLKNLLDLPPQTLMSWYGLALLILLGASPRARVNQQAPVQDEAVQVILGMNQKHILFPCLGIF